MELTKEILQDLTKPFPANKISIKVQTKPNEKGNALCVAYIDARDVMDRLDEVVAGEWSDVYTKAPSGGLECALTVCGVTRRDVGDDQSENETEKAGYSDAFKRAAVKFGIGRFLYSLPKMYAQVKTIGKNSYLADGEEARLQGIINAALNGKPLPKTQSNGNGASHENGDEIVTDAIWTAWTELIHRADAVRVQHKTFDRSKVKASLLKETARELREIVDNAEAQAKAGN